MNNKKTITEALKGRTELFGVLIFVAAFLIVAGVVAVFAIRTAFMNLKYRSICPNYHQFQEAYVVGPDGTGLDSVSVMMRDNSNINIIYKTFTDKTGKFTLFDDFNTFALYETPFSYYVYVSVNGMQDTVRYKFRRYKVCHFEKLEGPDTIRIDPFYKSDFELIIQNPVKSDLISLTDAAPYEQRFLSVSAPDYLKTKVAEWDRVLYGTLKIKHEKLAIAAVKGFGGESAEERKYSKYAVYYILDRNRNNDLTDDPVCLWHISDSLSEPDCSVRNCFAEDSVLIDGSLYRFHMQLRDFERPAPSLYYRNSAILEGTCSVQGHSIKVCLWDRGMTGFRDKSSIMIGVDLNGDGRIRFEEGSAELYQSALQTITLGSVSFKIDTVLNEGITIKGRRVEQNGMKRTEASEGAMVANLSGYYKQEFSLYKECAENDIVVLYFFEGNSRTHMQDPEMRNILRGLKQQIPRVRLIGINRRGIGGPFTDDPVVEENLGWNGALVKALHNYREREMICIDNTGTILCRGVPGEELLEKVLKVTGAN